MEGNQERLSVVIKRWKEKKKSREFDKNKNKRKKPSSLDDFAAFFFEDILAPIPKNCPANFSACQMWSVHSRTWVFFPVPLKEGEERKEEEARRRMSNYDVDKEVELVQQHMTRLAKKQADGTYAITFGEFFADSQVEQTFESLVGSLKAAKKRGVINFPGQMLLMPTHKDVVITLLKPWSLSLLMNLLSIFSFFLFPSFVYCTVEENWKQ